MEAAQLSDPVVRTVVTAMNNKDSDSFFSAFAPEAELTDDGTAHEFTTWAEREIFRGEGTLDVQSEGEGGLYLTGAFTSAQWGTFSTFWQFTVADGQVTRLDVGAL